MIHPSYSQKMVLLLRRGCDQHGLPIKSLIHICSAHITELHVLSLINWWEEANFLQKTTVLHVMQFLQWKMTIIEKCVHGCTRQGGWFGDEQLIIIRSFCIVNSCTLPKSSTKHTHTINDCHNWQETVMTLTVKWPNGLRISSSSLLSREVMTSLHIYTT